MPVRAFAARVILDLGGEDEQLAAKSFLREVASAGYFSEEHNPKIEQGGYARRVIAWALWCLGDTGIQDTILEYIARRNDYRCMINMQDALLITDIFTNPGSEKKLLSPFNTR